VIFDFFSIFPWLTFWFCPARQSVFFISACFCQTKVF
jgi:hypothetical protein